MLAERPPRSTTSKFASARGLFAEDLFHCLALGEFVDEFVEVADLAHHRLLNLLHTDAAYDAGDQKAKRVHPRRVCEEIFEARLLRKLSFQRGLTVAGEPAEDLVDLGPGAILLLRLGKIGRIDACYGHGIDAAPVGGGPGCCLFHGGYSSGGPVTTGVTSMPSPVKTVMCGWSWKRSAVAAMSAA